MDTTTNQYTPNQKLEPLLRAALSATPEELAQSESLDAGVSGSTGLWEVVVLYAGNAGELAAAFPQYRFTFLLLNYAILQLPPDAINALAASPLIIYVEKPKRLFFEILAGKRASCITPLQNASAGNPGSVTLTGRDTLVAVIDSGIDFTHPDFRNPDGSTRILDLWDQTIAGAAPPPEGYALGSLFTEERINEALEAPAAERQRLCPSRDSSGHGTHVAGIAAGNGRGSDGVYRGVAYEADLIIIKLGTPEPTGFPSTTQLMQAVDYCVRRSVALNRPIAVNLSFGNTYGSHSGTSLLETYLNAVSGLGNVSIIAGSGNEGSAAGHTGGRLRQNESRRVEFSVGEYEKSLSIQLWKDYWDEIRLSLLPPSGRAAVEIPYNPGSYRFRADSTDLLIYFGEPSPYSLYQEIYVELLGGRGYIAPGIWSFQLSAQRVAEGIYDLWMPAFSIRGLATQFLTPTPDITLTIPSTSPGVVTVGAYDSFSNTLATFSGRGFTWNTNQVKPDLVAPGVDITSSSPGGGYETRSGTSMATPFVTGSASLLMQWGIVQGNDPFLYGEKLKAYLRRGAKPLPGFTDYPNPQTGYGALCVRDSIPE
ncbi:MAG: S8 family serine peptidase [Muribaculaceae bacterium]|nr:S8 family serine peptidase [Roseburia sp.]MCM1431760.1 S8 family serine peptidase [Muribaculaceae bacterium]MCM1493374.1 S8 family serine peptidase [Muribaculaceae bacterium]